MNRGVYEIKNIANGKSYIGSAAISFARRWNAHRQRLRRGIHTNKHLQAAWIKYGSDAFEFKPLIICAREHAVAYEQLCLDAFKPQYNKCPTAGSMIGYKFSAKDCARKSAALIGNKHAAGGKGRRLAFEHRMKISAAMRGNTNPAGHQRKHSPETIEKIRIAAFRRTKKRAA